MKVDKQWRCRNEHTLGLVVRNGSDAPQLLIYRHAIDTGADQPAEVDVMIGPVTGMVPVKCDLCGDVRVWQVSVASMIYLVESMPTQLLFEFWRRLLERAGKGRVGELGNRGLAYLGRDKSAGDEGRKEEVR